MTRDIRRTQTPRRQSARRPRILCIDDDSQMRNLLRLQLKMHGLNVLRAPGGRDGVRLARRHHPDAILTDWTMSRGDGSLVLHRLRSCEATREIPVIVVSGRQPEDLVRLGADAFLEKPFSYDELMAVLSRFVELRGLLC